MKIKADALAREIEGCLKEYSEDVEVALEKTKQELGRTAVKRLKDTSPVGARGRYAKGWRVKKSGKKRIVHNKTDYQLTHLLEKGHAKVGGGRVDAIVHIEPVEKEVQRSAESTFRKKLK